MGIESSPSLGRVAGQTVSLGMTGDAAFQILPSRLAVVQGEVLLCIVITAIQRSLSAQPRVDMAIGAELARVVAASSARRAAGLGSSPTVQAAMLRFHPTLATARPAEHP